MLEERDAVSGDVKARYVWSVVYVDAMVLRDRDTDADGVVESTSAGDERLYVLHDANSNVTAVADTSGAAVERYLYDPYGERTVLDANWAVDPDGLSDFTFVHGHQGGRHYLATGLVDFRNRHLDTSLGRWERQDPMGYVDGATLYQFVIGNPISLVDPTGLQADEVDPRDEVAEEVADLGIGASIDAGVERAKQLGDVAADGAKASFRVIGRGLRVVGRGIGGLFWAKDAGEVVKATGNTLRHSAMISIHSDPNSSDALMRASRAMVEGRPLTPEEQAAWDEWNRQRNNR